MKQERQREIKKKKEARKSEERNQTVNQNPLDVADLQLPLSQAAWGQATRGRVVWTGNRI